MAVEELHDMEPAAVEVEMDVPLLKVRRDGLPDLDFGMQLFHRALCGIAHAPAVDMRRNEQKIEITRDLFKALIIHFSFC